MRIPLISCIIPMYNAEKYLSRCLGSVLNQTYTNIEVILVDDGSTDNSGKICDEYVSRDKRILVFQITNGGASLARKYGLSKARGEYITFVDSDDWVSPEYVSTLHQLIEEYGVNLSACGVQRVKEGEQPKVRDNPHKSQLLSFDELMPRFFRYEFWGLWGKLYRKESLESLTFPQATISEDYYVMAQLFDKERQITYTNKPLYFYEYHDNSLSHQKLSKRSFEEFENVRDVYDFICKNMPKYADNAFSNLMETCVKLYSLKKYDKENEFKEKFDNIFDYLKKNRRKIYSNKSVYKGIKFLALCLILYPKLFLLVFKIISYK